MSAAHTHFAALLARRSVAAVLTGVGLLLLSSVGSPGVAEMSLAYAQPAPGGPPALMSGGALPPLPEAETPPVARDIGVAELPLLVTEPPAEETEPELPAPVTGGADSVINPFSPLLLPQPEPAVAPAPTPPAAPTVTEQPPAPSAPTAAPAAAAPSRVAAPAPAARLGTPNLPATLGARMQPSAVVGAPSTAILGRTLGARSVAPANPLAGSAAIRVPASPMLAGTTPAGLTPVGLDNDGNFTSGRSNRVSRSLDDLRVDYTAMATGTGVFRVGGSEVPVLVRVGEPLPGTKLVLSRLTRADAQFSQDDARHTLSLTP